MSNAAAEQNGFVTPDTLFSQPAKRRYTTTTIEGLGKFRLRSLTAEEAAIYAAEKFTKDGSINRRRFVTTNARIIVLCCVDAEGNQIFNDDHVRKLQEMPAGPIAKLADECLEHCGLGEAEDEAKN